MDKRFSFSHYLKADLRRSVISWRFAGFTLLIPCIMVLSMSEYVGLLFRNGYSSSYSVMDRLFEILVFDRFKPTMVVLLSSLYCFALGDDLKTGFYLQELTRGSRRAYVVSKLSANAICVIFSSVLGFLLFSLLASRFMPLRSTGTHSTSFGPWQILVESPFPLLYPIATALQFSVYVVFLTTVSIWITVFRPNRFLALAVPYALFYVLYAVTAFLPMPLWVWYISSSVSVLPTTGFLSNFLYGLAFFLLPTFFCAWGCTMSFERKW